MARIDAAPFEALAESFAANPTLKGLQEALTQVELTRAIQGAIYDVLEERRTAGALKPCANLGDREVREIQAWNAFVGGASLKGQATGRQLRRHDLLLPFLQQGLVLGVVAGLPHLAKDGVEPSPEARAAAAQAMRTLPEQILQAISSGRMSPGEFGGTLRCGLSDERLALRLEDWEPVLLRVEGEDLVPAEPLKRPAPLFHLVLDLPTGELLVGDWINVPGLKYAVKDVAPQRLSLNTEMGSNAYTRDILEKAGIATVYVGNSSPGVFQDGDMLRLGWEQGRSGASGLDRLARTSTDLWWTTVADRATVSRFLLEQGTFHDQEEVDAAIHTWLAKPGANVIRLEPGELHIYSPSGGASWEEDGPFARAGVPVAADFRDAAVISRVPLPLGPEWVSEAWVRRPEPEAELPAPAP